MNRLMESAVATPPRLGDGATITCYTDRHAATVVQVAPGRVTVQEDFATRTDSNGMSDAQAYSYAPNPEGALTTFTLRENGRWVPIGERMASPSRGLVIGNRSTYHDYSF